MFARSLLRRAATTPRFALPISSSTTPLSSFLASRSLSSSSKAIIDQAVASHPLVVFMKGTPAAPQCGFSRAVIQILGVHGVPEDKMKTYNCLDDAELREGIKEYSDWPTIPQIYLSGEFVGGCDILLSMHSSGELETLLIKEGVIPEEIPAEVEEAQKEGREAEQGKKE